MTAVPEILVVGIAGLSLAVVATSVAAAGPSPMGEWLDDADGLPTYHYTGPLPAPATMPDGNLARIPDDPYFLLGNHRLTLFAHVSGRIQLLTGERAWARLNQGDEPNVGANDAFVEMEGRRIALIGSGEPAAAGATRHFGVGFARYEHDLGQAVTVTRTLSVRPSPSPGAGHAAFVTRIVVRNEGSTVVRLRYHEDLRAAFHPLHMEGAPEAALVRYPCRVTSPPSNRVLRADFQAEADLPMAFGRPGEMSRLEGRPPSLFLIVPDSRRSDLKLGHASDASSRDRLAVDVSLDLPAGAEREIAFVTAVGQPEEERDLVAAAADLVAEASRPRGVGERAADRSLRGAFGREWALVLPAFPTEPDAQRRREMRWNAAALEAMATYRSYYDETVVPQGTIYDYMWGWMASSRDLAQHALPLCHTNPSLARSVLRFLMKRMLPDGEIKLNDEGLGWSAHGPMLTSDQQLYFLMLLAEYLRATNDVEVLTDELPYYPLEGGARGIGLDRVRLAFSFIRDRIGVGGHGLMRLWNSDWNDAFYFWATDIPYNRMFVSAESHMNTAMAVVVLGDLSARLEELASGARLAPHQDAIGELVGAMRQHRAGLLRAFMEDWGRRPFPRRAYLEDERAMGADEMWLEPQGFTLLIPEVEQARKSNLLGEIERRLMQGEALGARQIERPEDRPGWEVGSRENGGFWFALNGPLVLGVASFDPERADRMLGRMSFASFARRFPAYWPGQWSASDTLESSLMVSEGLPDQTWTFADVPVYCAHSHAWPLYCYLRLRQAAAARR